MPTLLFPVRSSRRVQALSTLYIKIRDDAGPSQPSEPMAV